MIDYVKGESFTIKVHTNHH